MTRRLGKEIKREKRERLRLGVAEAMEAAPCNHQGRNSVSLKGGGATYILVETHMKSIH